MGKLEHLVQHVDGSPQFLGNGAAPFLGSGEGLIISSIWRLSRRGALRLPQLRVKGVAAVGTSQQVEQVLAQPPGDRAEEEPRFERGEVGPAEVARRGLSFKVRA
jgi:hypothetical protein